MAKKIINRLPEVKTLYEILPKGTEGGKEFARIVDLLLFHQARRAGKNITIYSDTAGDYQGLDSFEYGVFRKHGTTGYQYKFYPSPLSSKHRADIIKTLKHVAENHEKLKLRKWILVTPQDLIESSTRKVGGDVTWFGTLSKKLGLKFEIEHWGHRKLQFFFLETPSLCLFYYPELVPEGVSRKKTIQDTRKRYNDDLKTLYGKIEFVGMSVYKKEAAEGVPMEHIYIPLTAIPDAANESDPTIQRLNPISFLNRGGRHVVLGDPGSGKSTLLRFLALIGFSKSLQKRVKAKPDKRLPILVTLRRYADELKARKNLSLLDYILESVQGDFNLKDADLEFFEYYLETGQAILLFDGLDELPSPQFKKTVRDRIRTLITTYLGNTIIVTSRIVGYESPFRFDEKEFVHNRLTNLDLPEIEQFVRDWYLVRIENTQMRENHVTSLIRILQDEDQTAIRELAQNPLLLTIIALVHRIDAVLPDERHVLYQKCTETLLITWHTWKYPETEVKNRGKAERRNLRRIEAIAWWMHSLGEGTAENQRSVVPYNELKSFLTEHISKNEKYRDPDSDPEDMAEEFIEFVKKRAGLLVELGDQKYSFVHLTFQEYLTASHIITISETSGAEGIWEIIKKRITNDRWHEVIRLLIAGLKSDESQEFLIEKIIPGNVKEHQQMALLLAGGFLLDGLDPVKVREEEIFRRLLYSASKAKRTEQLKPFISTMRKCLQKNGSNEEMLCAAFSSCWKDSQSQEQKTSLTLIAFALNCPETKISELTRGFLREDSRESALINLFLVKVQNYKSLHYLSKEFKLLWSIQNSLSTLSSYGNLFAAVSQALFSSLGIDFYAKKTFEKQLFLLYFTNYGPFFDFFLHCMLIDFTDQSPIKKLFINLAGDQDRARAFDRDMARVRDLSWPRARARTRVRIRVLSRDRDWGRALPRNRARDRALARALARARDRALARAKDRAMALKSEGFYWELILSSPEITSNLIDIFIDIFALEPRSQWREALRACFLPRVPERLYILKEHMWEQVLKAYESGKAGITEHYAAACQLIFDSWLYIFNFYNSPEESLFNRLAELTREIDTPPLRIALCIHDLAYGDGSKADELVNMINSKNPQYIELFEESLWRLTPEEQKGEKEKKEKNNNGK